MKKFQYNFFVWLILQVIVPLFFVVYTFYMQFGVDEYDLLKFCKSQRLLLISAMTFLNMSVVLINTSRHDIKDDAQSKQRASLMNILSILIFTIIFMLYSLLITRADLVADKSMYIYISIGLYIVTIMAATLIKFDIEKKLIKIQQNG